jgi:FtsZ-binding cell division protein ZapB
MSSLLEQAIVDAKALKEAAMKNAEATIIDKYSEEVKSTLNQLLEQDELGALLGGDEPSADAEGAMEEEVKADEIAEGVPDAFTEDVAELDGVNEGDETEVTVDFAELAEALKQLREGVEEETLNEEEEEEAEEEPMDEELELDEESIMEMVASMLGSAAEEESDADQMQDAGLEEEVMEEGEEDEDLYEELSDDMLDAIMEKLTVDMGATLSGWAGRSSEDMKHQMELEMAHRRSTEVAEELEALKKAQEELVFENKKLKENLSNYQDVVNSLKENVQDVNLSNARLLYTNRTLRNSSLNERQKERIVEAISKAGSVEEAKTIHETLQSTVASTPARGPQSLSEAITRPTSIIRASRKEEPTADPFQARMRKLAGLE